MKILIGCEESQTVCKAFRAKGHEAYSCDLLPCSGGHPEWHLQQDVRMLLNPGHGWDFIISFPPCTDLAVSGARWFDRKRLSGEQEQSIRFFIDVWGYSDVVENPIGIMNGGNYIKKWFPRLYQELIVKNFFYFKPQIIQPWQFGHGETKATCLFKRNVADLKPTNVVEGRHGKVWRMPPTADRVRLRSKTYPGIAQAMADQWCRPEPIRETLGQLY